MAGFEIHHGDALDVLRGMADNSVDLICTDPPYFKVKNLAWDRQWDKPQAFLAWIGELCEQWQRVLKPNGSLYCFASPDRCHDVQREIRQRFNVLNDVRWVKDAGWHKKADKEISRSFHSNWESIIFAEHYGADNIAKGETGYAAKCDELRGFVFEPLRAYLDGERKRASVPHRAVIAHLGMTGHDSHFFSPVQWKLPLPEQYQAMRELFNAKGGDYLRREYDYLRREYEDLRREYEDLRREYEDLRRPFSVTADVPYTDVWDFATVQAYKGKHACEKPLPLMLHIIRSSTREGATVLDCFSGSASTGEACLRLGRNFVGVEKDEHWVNKGRERLAAVQQIAPVADFQAAKQRHDRREQLPTKKEFRQVSLLEICAENAA